MGVGSARHLCSVGKVVGRTLNNILGAARDDLRRISRFRYMPTLRRGGREGNLAARPGRPEILLTSESPYGSRRLVVEYDGVTTAAYVYDQTAVIAAVWLANHRRPRPPPTRRRSSAGQAPVMPAGHTKHPGGRPPLDPRILRALWFEEGDGVALVEGGPLLAVIPGWSDMSRGHARLQPGMHRPDPVRLVAGRRHGGAGPAGGPGHGLLALAGQRGLRGPASRRRPSGTCSAGSARAPGTGMSAAAGSRRPGCPSGRRPAAGRSRCCPRSA